MLADWPDDVHLRELGADVVVSSAGFQYVGVRFPHVCRHIKQEVTFVRAVQTPQQSLRSAVTRKKGQWHSACNLAT